MSSIHAPTRVSNTPMLGRLARSTRAEWRSVNATTTARALLVGSVVMAIASCTANLAVIDDDQLATNSTLELAMHASTVATLVFALVAGVVSATSDFRFGRIDQMLLSEPDRSIYFGAKALVGAVVGTIYGVVGAAAALVAITTTFSLRGAQLELWSEPIIRPVVGVVVGAALFAAIGIGVGNAIQNQPAAIAGSLAFMLIVEPTTLLGAPAIGKWLPGGAGLSLTNSPDPSLLPQLGGLVLLIAWTVAALTIGNHRLKTTAL